MVCETYQRDNAHEDDLREFYQCFHFYEVLKYYCDAIIIDCSRLPDITVMKNETQFEEGCEYKGKMYGVEEHFYDGCESSCLCLGLGEIDCNPR